MIDKKHLRTLHRMANWCSELAILAHKRGDLRLSHDLYHLFYEFVWLRVVFISKSQEPSSLALATQEFSVEIRIYFFLRELMKREAKTLYRSSIKKIALTTREFMENKGAVFIKEKGRVKPVSKAERAKLN